MLEPAACISAAGTVATAKRTEPNKGKSKTNHGTPIVRCWPVCTFHTPVSQGSQRRAADQRTIFVSVSALPAIRAWAVAANTVSGTYTTCSDRDTRWTTVHERTENQLYTASNAAVGAPSSEWVTWTATNGRNNVMAVRAQIPWSRFVPPPAYR